MVLSQGKLSFLLIGLCLIGYAWIFYTKVYAPNLNMFATEVCIIKKVTNLPCPSCGTTRSINAIIDGRIIEALSLNPFGFIVAVILVLAPVWVLFDVIFKANTLLAFYKKTEIFLSQKRIAMPLVLLVISNWCWNILKEF